MSNEVEIWVTTSTILDGLHHSRDDAWERLVGRFRAPIVRFAAAQALPPADCEDVAQETLIALRQALSAGRYDRGRGRLSRFLFGIAMREIVRARQRNARRAARVVQPEESAFLENVPDERETRETWDQVWEDVLWTQCIDRARREFEAPTFRAFLSVSRGASPSEAAAELGVPVKAVYNAKHRVLKRLRELRAQIDEEL